MRLLLDTHVLLWWLGDDPKLSVSVRSAIAAEEAEIYLSVASLWEIAIKRFQGKLEVEGIEEAITEGSLKELPICAAHAWAAGGLPPHHRDPFDRMLVAQAQLEGLTIVSRDPRINRYDVHVLAA